MLIYVKLASKISFHFVSNLKRYDTIKKVSEYDQEMPQSQTADNPVAPRGRAAQPSRDTRKYPHMYQNVHGNLLQKNVSIQELPLYKRL